MRIETMTRDHVLVIQAAHAYRSDQPMYAETILRECADPLHAAIELIGLLMQERAEGMQS